MVADEVRKLAEHTARSAGQIRTSTVEITQRTREALVSIERTVVQVEAANTTIDDSSSSLTAIDSFNLDVENASHEIALMVEQQAITATDIANNMETVNAMGEQNHASALSVGTSVEELRATAHALHELVRHFEKSL